MISNLIISILSILVVVYIYKSDEDSDYKNVFIVGSLMELLVVVYIVYYIHVGNFSTIHNVIVLSFVALTLYLSGLLKNRIIFDIKHVSETKRKYSQVKLLADTLRYIEIITIFMLNVNMWLGGRYA